MKITVTCEGGTAALHLDTAGRVDLGRHATAEAVDRRLARGGFRRTGGWTAAGAEWTAPIVGHGPDQHGSDQHGQPGQHGLDQLAGPDASCLPDLALVDYVAPELFEPDPAVAAYLPYERMEPGDVIAWPGQPRAEVLRTGEPYTDRIGPLIERQIRAHWCRTLDGTGREGWMPYGPGGRAPVEYNARHRPAHDTVAETAGETADLRPAAT